MISAKEEAELREMAKKDGRDPDEVVAAARKADGAKQGAKKKPGSASPDEGSGDRPKLFKWHTPFLWGRDIRRALGLTESHPSDNVVASDWAREHGDAGAGDGDEPVE